MNSTDKLPINLGACGSCGYPYSYHMPFFSRTTCTVFPDYWRRASSCCSSFPAALPRWRILPHDSAEHGVATRAQSVCRSGKTTEGNNGENGTKWLRRCLLMFRPKKRYVPLFLAMKSWILRMAMPTTFTTLEHWTQVVVQSTCQNWLEDLEGSCHIFYLCLVVVLVESTIIEPEMSQGKATWQQDYSCGRCFGTLVVCTKCCITR